jgi:hypothetical protein
VRNDFRDICEIENEVAKRRRQRQPGGPHTRVVCHDEHFREEPVDRGPQPGDLCERTCVVGRGYCLSDARTSLVERGQQRDLRCLRERRSVQLAAGLQLARNVLDPFEQHRERLKIT